MCPEVCALPFCYTLYRVYLFDLFGQYVQGLALFSTGKMLQIQLMVLSGFVCGELSFLNIMVYSFLLFRGSTNSDGPLPSLVRFLFEFMLHLFPARAIMMTDKCIASVVTKILLGR